MSEKVVIDEAYTKSLISRGKREKLSALRGAFAVQIARQSQDPLYAKLLRFKKAYKLVKKQIITKYGSKGYKAAMAAARAHGK